MRKRKSKGLTKTVAVAVISVIILFSALSYYIFTQFQGKPLHETYPKPTLPSEESETSSPQPSEQGEASPQPEYPPPSGENETTPPSLPKQGEFSSSLSEEGERERLWVSDVTPATGPGLPPVGEVGDGPWNHRLLIAISNDGLTWNKTYSILADQASVPDVVVDSEGFIRVYYVDYFNLGIVMTISRNLENWVYIKVKGINVSWVDPSIVILPDGRFRLYASYTPLFGEQNKILSAISDDGVHFKVEPGIRYKGEGVVTDPDVIYANGRWVMYLEEHSEAGKKLLMLTSEDGLTFKNKTEVNLEGGVPCLIKYEKGYRLYLHKEDFTSIITYYSDDLESWNNLTITLEKGQPESLDQYGVADPAIAKLPNGTYVMIYKTWINPPPWVKGGISQKISFEEAVKTHFSRVIMDSAVSNLNAHWIRVWIPWGAVEVEDGKIDFNFTDNIVRKAQSTGAILLITVFPFANWDQACRGEEYYGHMLFPWGKGKAKVGPPCNMSRYAEFLSKFVERYDGDGVEDMPGLEHPVKYWEIMNEPEMQEIEPYDPKFFVGTPEEYLEILKVSYDVIKKADPEAKVVMGGMAGMIDRSIDFWSRIIPKASNYFDIANIHSIDTRENREDLYVFSFKQFLEEYGVNKPVWVTEAQYGKLEEDLDPKWVGTLLVKSTVVSTALGADKIFFIWDNWRDQRIYDVYNVLINKLNKFDKVEPLEWKYTVTDEGILTKHGLFKFTFENKVVFVAWGSVNIKEYISGFVKVADIYGNSKTIPSSEVKLTNIPIYIEPLTAK